MMFNFQRKNSTKVMRFKKNAKIHGLQLFFALKYNEAKMGSAPSEMHYVKFSLREGHVYGS